MAGEAEGGTQHSLALEVLRPETYPRRYVPLQKAMK